MQHTEGWLAGVYGLDLYYQSWFPHRQAEAIVGMVHGLGSHSGWFMNMVRPLVAAGYGVYAFDLRGHGQSPGQRGYINHWAEFRGDLHQFWQLIVGKHPGTPCFALGHSLGAVIALEYALYYPEVLSGIVTLAPAIGAVGIPPLKLAIGQILSRAWPRFTLGSGLADKVGSQDPNIMTAYARDPLRHSRGTARLATEFLKTRHWIQSHLSELTTPILILHGGCDVITSPEGSRSAFAKLPDTDKAYREYPDAYHDLHNDTCAETVSQDILHWLESHTQSESVFSKLSHPFAGKTTSAWLGS